MVGRVAGWVVTVTWPLVGHGVDRVATVWYAACVDQQAALDAVKAACNIPHATFEISREMSETLSGAFGLRTGQVRCFD